VRRATFLLLAALLLPAPASADVRLPGGPLVALAAGPGAAYAVVGTEGRTRPFRLVRTGGRSASSLATFGAAGAEFADVAAGAAGPVVVFGRPTSDGFAYESAQGVQLGEGAESAQGVQLGEGTGPPVLGLDGATPFAVFPDNDGDAVIARATDDITTLTHTGPALRHGPLDLADGPLVLDLVQSGSRTELRVLGPGAPAEPLTSVPGLQAIPATIARDRTHLYVAYRVKDRVTLATARARTTGTWSRRRLRVKGAPSGAPAIARVGLRTLVATSQRVKRRRSIFLTTAGPAGTFLDRLTRPRGSDLAPLAATGPDGRVYVGWTRRPIGSSRRVAVLRRVL
jgi:hypothetical protein